MRVSKVGLIPLFFTTTAYAQAIDIGQPGWDLRKGDSAISEPMRLRPSTDPVRSTEVAASLPVPYVAPTNPPYTGYQLFGGTLAMGAGLGVYFDDNVFASSTTRRSDFVNVVRPEFAWQTFGSGYAFGLDGFLEAKAYNQYASENQVNGSVGASFKVMPTTDSQILGSARYQHGHLERGTSETVTTSGVLLSTLFDKPIEYNQGSASLVYNKRFDQSWMSVGGAGTLMRLGNPQIGNIANVDLGYANGHTETANLRLGHVVAPSTSVFVEVVGNSRNFDVNAFDSTGYRAVVGALFEPGQTSRLKGEIWGGYMNQDYRGPSFKTVSTFTYGGALNYALTDQLGIGIDGRREAKEAALSVGILDANTVGVSDAICSGFGAACVSAVQSSVGGRVDYRVQPNLGLAGGVAYIIDQYLGAPAGGRTDHTLSPYASVKYAMNNRVSIGFDYRRVNFNPSGGDTVGITAPSYARNIYLVSMAGKF